MHRSRHLCGVARRDLGRDAMSGDDYSPTAVDYSLLLTVAKLCLGALAPWAASSPTGRSDRCSPWMSNASHWDDVYRRKADQQTSWFSPHLSTSLSLIKRAGVTSNAPAIDVGGGSSTLVDDLLDLGFDDVTVLDLAEPALERSKARLGARAQDVHWVVGDIINVQLEPAHYGLWHDRAVFHFLTDPEARQRYVEQAWSALRPGGHIIVATFGHGGPEQCSGLDVVRYDDEELHQAFGARFEKVGAKQERHRTPWGAEQEFTYCYCRRS